MSEQGAPDVQIHATFVDKINFACHQSAFAILRELKVQSRETANGLRDCSIVLEASPAFLKRKEWKVDYLAPNELLSVKDRDLELDGGFLYDLNESMRGTVTVQVLQAGRVLSESVLSVELLACNEWGGAEYMPELLASFCTPNDPAIDRLLGQASQILRRAGKHDAIDGYRSGSRERVWLQASAIYSAVVNMQVSYALPPASFELNGQKIRLPGQIEDRRVATCLDSTLLLAAAFEQANLNPMIVLTRGHALVGLWLDDEDLSGIVLRDPQILRQRIPLKELILIETTLATQHPPVPFSRAVAAGNEQMSVSTDADFIAAVDIRRARAHRFNPISLKSPVTETQAVKTGGGAELTLDEAPDLDSNPPEYLEQAISRDTPEGRVERWQRKLLDLSARNPLLNYRHGVSSLSILTVAPAALEDLLASGAKVSIAPYPWSQTRKQDSELHQQRTGEELKAAYVQDAFRKNQVLVDLPQSELDRRAVEIYRRAQTSLREGGSNTLFLAMGFMLWRSRENNRVYEAPLVLLPVTLERKSVRQGIRIIANDDEPRFNTTLLEMLRRDFGIDIHGFDDALPRDEQGVDIPGIWNAVRHAIKDVAGFEVTEHVVLGHFSFAKYLMWKDLVDRSAALKESPVVRHLIESPRDPYDSDIRFVDASDIDARYSPADFLTPLPADSSQMSAIATADLGKDFVIIGPPGTGKSQTISNLIAHLLGKGKKVLFVSEKTAALEVVHRRLRDVGLGQFCLELHSNKASKADVLAQLGASWANAARAPVTQWQEEADRLKAQRDSLNSLVEALHEPHRNGLTAHYAIGVKVRDHAYANDIRLGWERSDAHDERQLRELRDMAGWLKVQAKAVGQFDRHPLKVVSHYAWDPQWQERLVEAAKALQAGAARLTGHLEEMDKAIGLNIGPVDLSRLTAIAELGDALLACCGKRVSFALEPDGQEQLEGMATVLPYLERYQEALPKLSCPYEPLAWQKLDADSLSSAWDEAATTWWPKNWFAKRKVRSLLRQGGAQARPEPENDIPLLHELRETGGQIDQQDRLLSNVRGWSRYDTDTAVLEELRTLGTRVRAGVTRLADDAESLITLRAGIRTLLHDGNDLLAPDAVVGKVIVGFLEATAAFDQQRERFETLSGSVLANVLPGDAPACDAIVHLCQQVTGHQSSLRDWCAWVRRRTEARELNLGPLVVAIEEGRVAPDDIPRAFEAAYCSWWSAAVIGENPVLRGFSAPEHEATIQRFRELDSRFCKLTADYIAAELSRHIPEQGDVTRSSHWGILRHELQKKARHKSVREMMQIIPDVVTTLAPCLMMSPLSIAQYLAADQALFDVVIFDEASQITVGDAIGSLARGRQVIVAGDPKQMPPTNFFSRSDDDLDGDIDGESDLESILDELIGASIPQSVLNLHYRSRRESLIAFSNRQYYDSSLVTFPAPVHPDNGVSLVRVNGVYGRGAGRTNPDEAKAIVKEIVRRLTSDQPDVREQSIGVVTFNTEQQALIEDLLDEARAKDPSIEWAFSEESLLEPVFVKNLETVQGDERDVILFSITYGPDSSGRTTMDFGPLNRTGGERRLNVALTRARSRMMVFTSMPPEVIDLSRTQARAVADLKHFMEFAERGVQAFGRSGTGAVADIVSPFEAAVAEGLQRKGWEVHSQVGASAYQVDLGIVHPEVPGTYLAGIECDGEMYRSAPFARERDNIRQSVMGGLGWTLYRVWATDWWTDPEKALETMDAALRTQLAQPGSR
ncbi:DUF4011 domain-containing protein [Marinobacter daepoensis]|uniref:DUF4011 domain-containing protein n=1 Tax=Marinobacter daepoensis TaxID=262077 RepID=UPI001C96F8C9|nr:DUF4011 domain-containing protein [Marinobacter daepoensis]MBY6033270.1 DUF4011 domain-containing protein [Marinobacter daepoensis]